jgi:hypothetical protein
MDLYHADIRLPDGFRLPAAIVNLYWTRHADRARRDDRYGEIPALPVLDLRACNVIEVGITGRKVEKVVVRTPFDTICDLVLVLIPANGAWTVKTVWFNECNDTHKTLDRSRYVR